MLDVPNNPRVRITCRQCGTTFEAPFPRRYCSPRCGERVRRHNQHFEGPGLGFMRDEPQPPTKEQLRRLKQKHRRQGYRGK